MSLFSMFIVYLLVWWVTLFAILPIGVRGQAEEGNIVRGSEPGAPVESDMRRKVKLNTLVATIIWAIICVIIHFELITLPTLTV